MSAESPALTATNLAKRFGLHWALRDCNVSIPTGKVVALVGPNGSGKSTLLRMAAGLSRPTSGSLAVLGESTERPSPALLARVGYLDQERPLYLGFRVEEMLRFGAATNPTWDAAGATAHLDQLAIPLRSRVGQLSGGQRAQVALTMCLAKQPDLLILDEPAAALDPVAREDLLRLLMQQVATRATSVIVSTHALSDVATICDYLVIVSRARVVLSDDVEFVVSTHRLITAALPGDLEPPPGVTVIDTRLSSREVTHLVRVEVPVNDGRWRSDEATLEEIVLAYLREGTGSAGPSAQRIDIDHQDVSP